MATRFNYTYSQEALRDYAMFLQAQKNYVPNLHVAPHDLNLAYAKPGIGNQCAGKSTCNGWVGGPSIPCPCAPNKNAFCTCCPQGYTGSFAPAPGNISGCYEQY